MIKQFKLSSDERIKVNEFYNKHGLQSAEEKVAFLKGHMGDAKIGSSSCRLTLNGELMVLERLFADGIY